MKKFLKILPVVIVVCVALTSVFAIDIPTGDLTDGAGGITNVNSAVKNIWATVITIVRILAIAAVVFAGLRYMFASADQKADIKKSMGILAVGAILVFSATVVLNFLKTATNDILGQ